MRLFAISDLHLSLGVDKPMDIFGDQWIDHGEKIRQVWDAEVTDDDWVMVGGDTSWGLNLAEAQPEVLSELVAAYDEFAEENGVIPPHPRGSLRSNIWYEGECNWWCETKFSFVNTLANPTGRIILLVGFLAAVGLLLFFAFRWLRRRRKVAPHGA